MSRLSRAVVFCVVGLSSVSACSNDASVKAVTGPGILVVTDDIIQLCESFVPATGACENPLVSVAEYHVLDITRVSLTDSGEGKRYSAEQVYLTDTSNGAVTTYAAQPAD